MDRPSIHKFRFPKTTKSILLLYDHTAQLWNLMVTLWPGVPGPTST